MKPCNVNMNIKQGHVDTATRTAFGMFISLNRERLFM